MNDDYELRPRDHIEAAEEKPGLLKAGAANDNENARRWKSAASDPNRIPDSVSQGYNSGEEGPEGVTHAPPARSRLVSESFKTRTNTSNAASPNIIVIAVVLLIVGGVALCKYVLKVF